MLMEFQDEVFQNKSLNDMMEKYQANNISRDIFYEEQFRKRLTCSEKIFGFQKREEQEQKALAPADDSESVLEELKKGVEDIVEGAE